MIWSSWSEFFSMGGYGVYVWGSYIVTFACIVGEVMLISKRRRTLVETYGLIHDASVEENSDKETSLKKEEDAENQDVKDVSYTQAHSNKEETKNETSS